MVQLSSLQARRTSRNEMTISWIISGEDIRRYQIRLMRSESRFGPFDAVTSKFRGTKEREFTDSIPTGHPRSRWYYKLEITLGGFTTELPTGMGVTDEPSAKDDPEARMAAEDYDLQLKNGKEVIYFPVRTQGDRCPECYDEATGAKTASTTCKSCYGSTLRGGFLTPLKISILQTADIKRRAELSGFTGTLCSATFPWYVDVKKGDIVVEDTNLRWKVEDPAARPIEDHHLRRTRIFQRALLSQIPLGSVEYDLPVPGTISEPPRGWAYALEDI